MQIKEALVIEGRKQGTQPFTASGSMNAAVFEGGVYAVWSDADCWIKVAAAKDGAGADAVTPNRAQDVTNATGYKIVANAAPVMVQIDDGRRLGVVGGGAGNLFWHRVG